LFWRSGDDNPVIEIDADQFLVHRPFRREVSIGAKDGRVFWIDLNAVPVPDDRGEIRHWVLIGSDGLLCLARAGASDLHVTNVDISEMAQAIADRRLASEHPARSVAIAIEPGIQVQGDGSLLQLTLENLLANARKHTAKRGDAQVQIDSELCNGERLVAIRDNGVGFNMADVSELGRPFYRLHRTVDYPGVGLGLSIVDRILPRHGASLDIRSERGTGSASTLIFPEAV